MIRVHIGLLVILLLVVRADGQPIQPRQDTWGNTVAALAGALAAGDPAALDELLDAAVTIRSFPSDRREDSVRLLAQAHQATVISARGYPHPPASVATDLAEDFARSEAVPEPLRQRMLLADEAEQRRANDIARRWITEVLEPAEGHRVGVIVLWPASREASPLRLLEAPAQQAPIFILVLAEPVSAGQFRITRIVHGDPQAR